MSRLPPLRPADLDHNQAAVWERLIESRGDGLVGADGGLVGPFNAFVHAPEVGANLASLGRHLRFGLSVERRLVELAICTVGARWKCEFEFWAHRPMAIDQGIEPSVLEALRQGRQPDFERNDEAIVHAVTIALVTEGSVDDDLYGQAEDLLGPTGLVELVSLVGYYCLISLMLNLFTVEVPGADAPIFAD
jgi:4-carboxymuconolactone decarboxylase